ncbi:hypothetical protein ACG7TL_006065 [Trametes sanguinea]
MPMEGLSSFLSAVAPSLSALDLMSSTASTGSVNSNGERGPTQSTSSLSLPEVLTGLLSVAVTLECLSLIASDAPHLSPSVFSQMAHLKSLRSLSLSFTKDSDVCKTFDALINLASLETLEDLSLTPGFGKGSPLPKTSSLAQHTLNGPLFNHLLSLRVVQDLDTTVLHHDLYRLLQSPVLHTLEVAGTGRCASTAACFRHNCEIWARYFPSLRSFSAIFWGGDPVDDGTHPLSQILGPLTALGSLTSIRLRCLIEDASIGDPDVDAISLAWPQLEVLDCFDLAASRDLAHPVGPFSLIHLASRCPNLKTVGLPYIDLQHWVPSSLTLQICPVLEHALHTLKIMQFLNHDDLHVCARAIARLFPDIDVIGPLLHLVRRLVPNRLDAQWDRDVVANALNFWTAVAICQDARTQRAFY